MPALFDWPAKAMPQQTRVPKARVFSHKTASAMMQRKFREEVEDIHFIASLKQQSVNTPPGGGVSEIAVFRITQRAPELSDKVLTHIDTAMPRATFFELQRPNGEIQVAAAFKRPSAADKSKWVTDAHYRTVWLPVGYERRSLPTAVHLGGLYAALLRAVWPYRAFEHEALDDQAARLAEIKKRGREVERLAKRLKQEQQFNRRVEINEQYKQAAEQLRALTHGV